MLRPDRSARLAAGSLGPWLALVGALAFADGCACGGPLPTGDGDGDGGVHVGDGDGDTVGDGDGDQTGDGDGDQGGDGDGDGDADGRTLVIEPADAVLVATVGGAETLQLTAFIVEEDGSRAEALQPFWGSLDPSIATIDHAGVLAPTRARAGTVRVRARAEGIEGLADVDIVLHELVDLGGGVVPGDFDGAVGAGPGPSVLYPPHEVVIPANLAPILFQWDKVKTKARVSLSGAGGSLALYTDGDRAAAPTESWRRFLVAHLGGEVTVVVEESDGPGTERVVTTQSLKLADADLTSTVYYWAVDLGRIVRIDADSLDPLPLDIPFENVPEGGVPGAAGEQQCRACHTLSADGQRMAFTYFGGNGPGGVVDTGDLNAPVLPNRDARRWNYAALNPDGSLLVTNYQRRLSLRSGLTGEVLGGLTDLTAIDSAMPVFSPVGYRVAFAGNLLNADGTAVGWEIDFPRSDLFLLDVNPDPANPTVGSPSLVVPSEGRALYYPSFSPDGRLLAYTAGPHSRSALNGAVLPGELWLAAAHAAPGADGVPRLRLDGANPGNDSYLPTFNPKVEGGYLWVAFYSRRDYGHVIRGQQRPQIWVAAVDQDADPALSLDDPSHPGFWLPGQNADTDNLSSYFAPKPCAGTGGGCTSDASCCFDLLCRPVGGVDQCVPEEEACLLTGDACAVDGDCCEGLLCAPSGEGGAPVCLPPGEVCSQSGQVCALDADCCAGAGLCLDDGAGQTRCLEETEPTCATLNQPCNEAVPCCEGAGICLNEVCLVIDG